MHERNAYLRRLCIRVNKYNNLSANVPQMEVVHPTWPTLWPRLLTDGKLLELKPEDMVYQIPDDYTHMRPLTKKNKQFLWECE